MDPAGQTLIEMSRGDDPFRPQSFAAICWRGGNTTVESVLFRPLFSLASATSPMRGRRCWAAL